MLADIADSLTPAILPAAPTPLPSAPSTAVSSSNSSPPPSLPSSPLSLASPAPQFPVSKCHVESLARLLPAIFWKSSTIFGSSPKRLLWHLVHQSESMYPELLPGQRPPFAILQLQLSSHKTIIQAHERTWTFSPLSSFLC